MRRNGEKVIQRAPVERGEFSVLVAIAAPHLGHGADAANGWNAVTHRTTISVEGGPQSVFGRFNFGEVVQADAEQFEFLSRDSRQWIARQEHASRLTESDAYREQGCAGEEDSYADHLMIN